MTFAWMNRTTANVTDLDDSHQGGEYHGYLHPPGISGHHVQHGGGGGGVGHIGGCHVKHGVRRLPQRHAANHQADHCKSAWGKK